jgi:two-component system chemotaxis response regulator CheY
MRKILIVDDSPTIRRMVSASLGTLTGVAFEEAANGLEAIEILARGGVSLIILDLNMPQMHGLEVLQFLRSHDMYRNLPVIVLTTKYDEESRAAALNHGANEYLAKPFQPAVLLERVSRLLNSQ